LEELRADDAVSQTAPRSARPRREP